ncbi:MAG TPA: pyrroloquinoline quinone biosynthesis peptide chaperone PqqD [Janthinobacterium sp.]|jgi:pyrroloquinoline quinone biosynthesis protein D|nr:pyrroloquinoline quinone biosynthesis peptide chaperone PqqD [Janthinobacterium sp.]
MSEPTFPAAPALNRRFRMQWEEAQQCHVLLYPEGMVRLNGSAAEILQCCDGVNTVDQIVATLEAKFKASGLRADIQDMLAHAYAQNWIV